MTGGLLRKDQGRSPASASLPQGERRRAAGGPLAAWEGCHEPEAGLCAGPEDGHRLLRLSADRVRAEPMPRVVSGTTVAFKAEGGFWRGCRMKMWPLGLVNFPVAHLSSGTWL